MKIQSLQAVNSNFIPKFNHAEQNKTSSCVQGNFNSIYSKGMTQLAFGAVNKTKQPTHFEQEISEQAEVLQRLSNKYFLSPTPQLVDMDLGFTKEELDKVKRIHIIASGSSRNAAEMAKPFMEKVTNIPVNVEVASEFIYKDKPMNADEDIAIFVSQSGSTADTMEALNKVSQKGIKTIAVTNNPESKMAKAATYQIPIEAGEEKAVAATKSVTSSVFNLMAIGLKLADIKEEDILNESWELENLPSAVEHMLNNDNDIKKAAKVISQADNIYYYAKGSNVAAAKEGCIKMTETTGKRIIADSSGEALHGTFASIKPENPVVQVIIGEEGEPLHDIAIENIQEMTKKRNIQNPIIMRQYSPEPIPNMPKSTIYLEMPSAEESISPILTTIKFQQLTNEVCKILGINPDNGGGFLTKYRQNITM
ncbi:SIS domain-containing protein [bacterium]|nr:SIS domain-containing protein [bacterium]